MAKAKGRPSKPESLEGTVRGEIAAHLKALVGPRNRKEIADKIGVTPDALNKALAGGRLPDPERWPALAAALGLAHYSELFPRPKKSSEK